MSRSALFGRLNKLYQQARPAGAAPSGPTRRDLLRAFAGAVAAVSAGPALTGCAAKPERTAIIGAGLAGVHCAWRLDAAGADVTLFEANDRVGGRTWTGRGLFAEDQICELGGELIDSNHATLWQLAEELDIAIDDRTAPPYDEAVAEVFWIDGVAIDDATLLTQLTAVAPDIQADYDAAESDDDAYAALDVETLADWLLRRVPPATYPELHHVLSVAYRGEFGLENDQQSALNLIYLVGLDTDEFRIFGESDERWHTHLGNDTFCTLMADAMPAGIIRLEHVLTSASGAGPFDLSFDTPDGPVTETFDRVVFALPYSVLRGVDLSGLALSDLKRTIIDEIGYGTNAKVMAGFSRPVWFDDHGASGSATSDLPFQQCWSTTIGQSGSSAILTNFLGGDQGVASGEGTPEQWVTDVLLGGVDTLWPGTAAAYTPGSAVRMHWPTVPTAMGSYTCYKPGQWAWWSLEGEREGNLHFCGEHTSADFQGWMEGGAESGARVALEILDDLGLDAPAGLARLRTLRRLMPDVAGTPLRRLRARRGVLRSWAALHGRG